MRSFEQVRDSGKLYSVGHDEVSERFSRLDGGPLGTWLRQFADAGVLASYVSLHETEACGLVPLCIAPRPAEQRTLRARGRIGVPTGIRPRTPARCARQSRSTSARLFASTFSGSGVMPSGSSSPWPSRIKYLRCVTSARWRAGSRCCRATVIQLA